ncbi:MAG: class I SAM-dependent methyltransferase [Thermodesulfobacteriota bacterium]
MTQTDDIELRKIDEFVKLEGKQILEVGCGDGRLTAFLAQKADKVTAIDPEENQIKAAKAAVQGADFQIGYGEALAFPEESFDLVFFSYSLHHQNCSTALSEARRVLNAKGEILIIEPTVNSEYTKLVTIFQNEEPALLKKAQKAIELFSTGLSRQEVFVDHHFFDTEEMFLDHYITSYGNGTASQDERQRLCHIIGQKRFNTPICVEDECTIILISG